MITCAQPRAAAVHRMHQLQRYPRMVWGQSRRNDTHPWRHRSGRMDTATDLSQIICHKWHVRVIWQTGRREEGKGTPWLHDGRRRGASQGTTCPWPRRRCSRSHTPSPSPAPAASALRLPSSASALNALRGSVRNRAGPRVFPAPASQLRHCASTVGAWRGLCEALGPRGAPLQIGLDSARRVQQGDP